MRVGSGLVLFLFVSSSARAADFAALPAHPGRDLTLKVCSQCHSPEIVATQRLDQAGWKALVEQMASNGAQATDAEFDTIAKYLAISFPTTGKTEASPASTNAANTAVPTKLSGKTSLANPSSVTRTKKSITSSPSAAVHSRKAQSGRRVLQSKH